MKIVLRTHFRVLVQVVGDCITRAPRTAWVRKAGVSRGVAPKVSSLSSSEDCYFLRPIRVWGFGQTILRTRGSEGKKSPRGRQDLSVSERVDINARHFVFRKAYIEVGLFASLPLEVDVLEISRRANNVEGTGPS